MSQIDFPEQDKLKSTLFRFGWREEEYRREQTCTGPSLRGHIVNAHLRPSTLFWYGIPRFDVELAEARGFNLGWVVHKAIQRLEQADDLVAGLPPITEIQKSVFKINRLPTATEYRVLLARTLALIDNYNLASVDWERVENIIPGARVHLTHPELQRTGNRFPRRWESTLGYHRFKEDHILPEFSSYQFLSLR
jgi:hypothetical protein